MQHSGLERSDRQLPLRQHRADSRGELLAAGADAYRDGHVIAVGAKRQAVATAPVASLARAASCLPQEQKDSLRKRDTQAVLERSDRKQ
jgi:hypothetical protein